MSADQVFRSVVYGVLLCGGLGYAEEQEAPELDFLEYLGTWEESDEEWQIFNEAVAADNEERSDPAPEGEESMEKEDEG